MSAIDLPQPAENSFRTDVPAFMPWLVCFSGALFFCYEFIQMDMFNSIGTYLMKDYGINATQLGNLSAWYFHSTLIFLLVAGLILDRISTRRVILAAMFTCVIGTVLFASSSSLLLASVCRFIAGIGSAFCFLSNIRLASRWFPPTRMALISGLVVTMGMFGGILAQTPLTLLANALGWREALYVLAGLGALITLMVWFFVQDCPPSQRGRHNQEQIELQKLGFWKAQRKAIFNRQNWLAGLYTSSFNLPVSLLGALWGNAYLQQVSHLSATQASGVTSMIFLGTLLGGPFAGWISDRMGFRRRPMFIGALISIGLILTIIYVPDLGMYQLLVLFLLLGLSSSTQVISYSMIAESNPRILTATSVSVVSFMTIGGYSVFQPLFGRIMDSHWSGHMANGLRIYSAADYRFAILIIPTVFVVGLIAAWLLRETYCKPID